ncbi:MAG TPA: ion transporter [Bacteroidetes bacterium]|nr:ion transporter [Bacteroidota bacterium]
MKKLRDRLHEIIFEADTYEGKLFDIILLILIVISIIVVMLESIQKVDLHYHNIFVIIEWVITIAFTIEYILRIYTVYKPFKYITSFFGIIDLLAILPTYLSIFFVSSKYLLIVRALRLLRMFRILKMGNYVKQGKILSDSIKASMPKITVFLYFVVLAVIVFGSIMYIVEGDTNAEFDNIPRSIYWAIVTLTTVGYGDIAPATPFGQFLASLVMILGYAVIAVPTGIITAEISYYDKKHSKEIHTQACRFCGQEGHDNDAKFCKYCGHQLNE